MKKIISIILVIFIPCLIFAAASRDIQEVLSTDYGVQVNSDGDLGHDGIYDQKIVVKTATFTYDPTEGIPVINSGDGSMVMILPPISDWADRAYRNIIHIVHATGGNNLTVHLSGAETFTWGNTYFDLGTQSKGFTFAAVNHGALELYGILRNTTIHATSQRVAAWNATNFSSVTIIPWDNELHNNQDEILAYTAGASARYTVLTAGDYVLSYTVDINSTGGATPWTATAQIYKNGGALAGTIVSSGNSKNGDQSFSMIPDSFELAASDYLDLRLIHSGLTGELLRSTFNISIRL